MRFAVFFLVAGCSGASFVPLPEAGADADAGMMQVPDASEAAAMDSPGCMPRTKTAVPQPIVPADPIPASIGAAQLHDIDALCDPAHQTGTKGPIAVCNAQTPCPNSVTMGITPPTCKTDLLLAWQDSVGTDMRYACAPMAAPALSADPVPLVVFFTPSFTSADSLYGGGLRAKADDWAWSYGAKGFVLVILQERNLQIGPLGGGMHEDIWYRPARPEMNPDVRNADALIDWAVAYYGARIDRRRIYVTGFSNGAVFGQLYAIARNPTTSLAVSGSTWGSATPGGNFIAAASVYSGDDPFMGFPSGDCGTKVYPTTQTPIRLSHRQCDLVPCEETQQECSIGFMPQSFETTTGASTNASVEFWLKNELGATSGFHAMKDPNAVDVIFDVWGNKQMSCVPSAGGTPNNGCNAYATWVPTPANDPTPAAIASVPVTNSGCSPTAQTINHVIWPSGDEPEMLGFMEAHTVDPLCP